MSQSRTVMGNNIGITQPPHWRSQSQAPAFDRAPHSAASGYETPNEQARRGAPSDTVAHNTDFTAQELWLASQGPNLGNVASGSGSLGLAFEGYNPDSSTSRGRDTSTRGLETPGGFGHHRHNRKSPSGYDNNGGSGSISAPLSPHRLYAQLEMGTTQANPVWGSGFNTAYDSRHHLGVPNNTNANAGASTSTASHRIPSTARSSSLLPTQPISVSGYEEPPSPLPAFAPFSPPSIPSSLKPLNGEPASYISPSTLLSPANHSAMLESSGVEALSNTFEQLGVNPPGQGKEDVRGSRKQGVESGEAGVGDDVGGIGASGPGQIQGKKGENGKKQKSL